MDTQKYQQSNNKNGGIFLADKRQSLIMIELSGRQSEFYDKQWMYPHLDNFYFDNAGEEDPTLAVMREMPIDLEDADMLGMHLDVSEMPPTIQ